MRPRTFNGVMGQTITKNIMQTNLRDKTFPNFSAVVGDIGIGKTTLAEICGLALTCESGKADPCLECPTCVENLKALASSGKSHCLVKINAALLDDKKDMTAIIKEIFVLEQAGGINTVYIIEEFQELTEEKQNKLLEEVGRVPAGVYIILCSSKEYKISRAIRSRAFMFRLAPPSKDECFSLIDNLTGFMEMPKIPDSVKYVLVRKTGYTPREIDKIITVLKNCDDFNQTVMDYLRVIDNAVYVSFLAKCFEPLNVFIQYMNGLKDAGQSFSRFYDGLEDFFLDIYSYRFAGDSSLFSKDSKEIIAKVFNQLDINRLTSVVDYISGKKPSTETDAYFKLVSLKSMIVKSELTSSPIAANNVAVLDKIKSERNYSIASDVKRETGLEPVSDVTMTKTNTFHSDSLGLPR